MWPDRSRRPAAWLRRASGLAAALAFAALLAARALAVEPGAPDADHAFEEIVTSATPDNRPASCERMERWVAEHRSHRLAPRGLVWISQLRRADRRPELAHQALERVLRDFPKGEWSLQARQGLAELDAASHHYQAALDGFAQLAKEPEPLWQFLGRTGVERTTGERDRFTLALVFLIGFASLSFWRLWRSGLRSLWPPPPEFGSLLPILLLLVVAAAAQEHDEAGAVLFLALGLGAALWLNGAWLRARAGRGRVAGLLLGAFQAGGLLYCALVFNNLWFKLIDTIAMGAE